MSTYTTPALLRVSLGLDDDDTAALSDAAAELLIDDAEDRIDRIIGAGGPTNATTGRSITPTLIAQWRRDRLAKATNLLAAAMRTDATAFLERVDGTIKGPDFEVAGSVTPRVSPAGQAALRSAAAILDSAALRRLTARTTA